MGDGEEARFAHGWSMEGEHFGQQAPAAPAGCTAVNRQVLRQFSEKKGEEEGGGRGTKGAEKGEIREKGASQKGVRLAANKGSVL